MAKANSGKQGSRNTGKQQKQSLQRRTIRTRKKAPEKTTRKKKASLAEVLAVLTDLLSEVRAMRLAVNQQSGVDRQSVTGIGPTPDKTSSGGDSRPEPEVVSQAGDKSVARAGDNELKDPSDVPEERPDLGSHPPIGSGAGTSNPDATVADAHKLAFNAGLAKREHKPLDVLVRFYEKSLKGDSVHTRKQLTGVPESSGHIIGELFRQMRDMNLLEPAGKPVRVTDKARANNRHNAPIRGWKLTDLGKKVAKYELKRREQAAAEQRASANTRDANSSVTAAADAK